MAVRLNACAFVDVWVSDPGIFFGVNAELQRWQLQSDALVEDESGETGLSHQIT